MSFWSALWRLFGGGGTPKPQTWQLGLSVFPEGSQPTAVIATNGRLVMGEPEPSGHLLFHFQTPAHQPGAPGLLTVTAPGYVTQIVPLATVTPADAELKAVTLVSAFIALPRLVPNGHVFQLETGERFTAIQCSDFNLFGRFLTEGADAIRQVLIERRSIGFNMLRVWTRYEGNAQFESEIGHLLPSEHPEFYDQLPIFCQLAASFGLYLELTAYCGGERDDHWDRLGAAVQAETNVSLDLINEGDDYPNGIRPEEFSPIAGVLSSRGSYVQHPFPPRPAWNYETAHTNDQFEWWRKGGHNYGMEFSEGDGMNPGSGVPCLVNENTRPDHDGNLQHHEDAAAACTLLGCGSCFHSQSGKRSSLFTDADRPFAEAFVRGALSVPLDCQDGPYRHRADLEGPDDLRVYQRGDSDTCIVHIRK